MKANLETQGEAFHRKVEREGLVWQLIGYAAFFCVAIGLNWFYAK